jgi:hypothetical protein
MQIKYLEARPTAVVDTECYANYWAIQWRDVETLKTKTLEMHHDTELDVATLVAMCKKWRMISFNGYGYDMPMIAYAATGATTTQLKAASDAIIQERLKPWEFADRFGVTMPDVDHIDVQQVSPGAPQMPSLKLYVGRVHGHKMQDLPYEEDQWLTDDEKAKLKDYLGNDTLSTRELYLELKAQIDLRCVMSEKYGVDLRSKSDAQIAEAVIKTSVERITGKKVWRPEGAVGTFKYIPPQWMAFETPYLQEILRMVREAHFSVDMRGAVVMPAVLKDTTFYMGDLPLKLGIGGLHSIESSVSHYSNESGKLKDRDVTSYYPKLIDNEGWAPPHIGQNFLTVYRTILTERIRAKKAGEGNTAETLKIVLNGSFGKFGSAFSALYAPNLMIQVTITGQLALLMFIERLIKYGIKVVSANTDGVVSWVPVELEGQFQAIVFDWEMETGLQTEEVNYTSLHSRDVNNYIAITPDGKAKRKGAYAPTGPGQKGAMGLKLNPTGEISTEAVIAFLTKGTPILTTIQACTDIRKFIHIRRVNGGANDAYDEYIGKAIRWYYSVETSDHTIHSRSTGNTVARSAGAKPIMELPEDFPHDVDFEWYERDAFAMLQDLGIEVRDPAHAGRSGFIYAKMEKTKSVHVLDLDTSMSICGKRPPSLREPWQEFGTDFPTNGLKLCSHCKKLPQRPESL